MKRGEIWWVEFDPAMGSEVQKTRPAIIVSNDTSNRVLNRYQVIPITSQTTKLYPSEAYITVQERLCKAMADQLRTVSVKRIRQRIGKVQASEMLDVDDAIKRQLDLS